MLHILRVDTLHIVYSRESSVKQNILTKQIKFLEIVLVSVKCLTETLQNENGVVPKLINCMPQWIVLHNSIHISTDLLVHSVVIKQNAEQFGDSLSLISTVIDILYAQLPTKLCINNRNALNSVTGAYTFKLCTLV